MYSFHALVQNTLFFAKMMSVFSITETEIAVVPTLHYTAFLYIKASVYQPISPYLSLPLLLSLPSSASDSLCLMSML